jgi:hypothetical protein
MVEAVARQVRAIYAGGVFCATEPLDLPEGTEVEVVIRTSPSSGNASAPSTGPVEDNPAWRALVEIWARRKARGATPRTAEDIEADIAKQRREWDERQQQIEEARNPAATEGSAP